MTSPVDASREHSLFGSLGHVFTNVTSGKQLLKRIKRGAPSWPLAPGSFGRGCFYPPAGPQGSPVWVHSGFRQQPTMVSRPASTQKRSQPTWGLQLPTKLRPNFARITKSQQVAPLKASGFFNRDISIVLVGALVMVLSCYVNAKLRFWRIYPFDPCVRLLPSVAILSYPQFLHLAKEKLNRRRRDQNAL